MKVCKIDGKVWAVKGSDYCLRHLGITPKVTEKKESNTMSEVPEGYEPAEVSHAKNVVYDALEAGLEAQNVAWDVDPLGFDDDEPLIDLIGLADYIVESLLAVGVKIPEDLPNPHLVVGL